MQEKTDIIKQVFQKKFPTVSSEDLDAFVGICRYKSFKNKELLIKTGSTSRNYAFIISGVVRGYFINNEGVEKNLFLRAEGSFVGSSDHILDHRPTRYSFESILECEMILFNLDDFDELCQKYPSLYTIYLWGVKYTMITVIDRLVSMIDRLPEERYEDLLKKSPIFFQKAFNKHIANYLGITPVSLSRIIKRRKNASSSQ